MTAKPRSEHAVRMRGMTKRFPLVLANDAVDFDVRWGEVVALVGENGAGKSTLMRILYGMQRPDRGSIELDGQPVTLHDPRDAIARGVGMVHQHFMLVDPLTVTENIVLGAEPMVGAAIDLASARRAVGELLERFGFDIDPAARIEDLPVGAQQRVEILKTLYRKARILILDEPTAVLTPLETRELFAFLRDFAREGNAVVFISHKLREVIEVSDRITVMRDGRSVGTLATPVTTPAEIARLMVGRDVILKVDKDPASPGQPVLEIEKVSIADGGQRSALKSVSFEVRAGEIVGIAGVEGNGQTELVEAVTGLRQYSGVIRYLGQPVPGGDTRRVRDAGLSHIPEDRNERGLVMGYSTAENLILGDHASSRYSGNLGLMDFDAIERDALARIEAYDVRPRSTRLPVSSYSGGNAQKVVVARELSREPQILVAAQPTRGVDIGAIEFIHAQLVRARDAGLGVLLVSADLGEVLSLSDRILVMYEGEIVGEVRASEATEGKLGLLMAGVRA